MGGRAREDEDISEAGRGQVLQSARVKRKPKQGRDLIGLTFRMLGLDEGGEVD